MGDSFDIVLADDQIVILDALAALLTQFGHRVVARVGSCAATLECVSAYGPDVCVIGNRFPDGDGVDTIELLSQLSPQTKIVMLTGPSDIYTMRRALDAGAVGFVHTTRDAGVFLDVLRRVVEGEIVVEGSFLRRRWDEPIEHPQVRRLASFLTHRETDCLALLVEGLDTAAMASRLGLSGATVRTHVQSVLTKLGVHSRLEAASVATRYGLLDLATEVPRDASGWHR